MTTVEFVKPIDILLVEDNPGDARLIQEMLSESGQVRYQLECVDRLSKGLERLVNGGIDVVLLDLGLPDIQGLDAFDKVQAQAPAVPIVVLTGFDDEMLAVEAVRQGAQDYLVKGDVDSTLLYRAVLYAVERKRVEEALRESELRYRLLADNATDIIWTSSLDLTLTYVSPSVTRILGYSAEEVIGNTVEGFLTPASFEVATKVLAEELAIESMEQKDLLRSRMLELEMIRKDGSTVWVEANANFLHNSDNIPVGVMGVLRDITERKQIEEMKSDFVSLVSHQLKTPVLGIKAGIENMLEGLAGDLTTEQKQYLQDMHDICVRNYRLVTNLLNISVIERGVLSLGIKPVKLREIVDLAVHDYRKSIEEKGLALTLEETGEKVVVRADTDKTVEALSNVINNAVKFTDKGSITIKITSEGKYGIVEVRDTGEGISDDVLNTLFTKEKILSDGAKAGGSAGLGLYIAKNFMEVQEGDITATSVVGEGSTFVLSIPRERRKTHVRHR